MGGELEPEPEPEPERELEPELELELERERELELERERERERELEREREREREREPEREPMKPNQPPLASVKIREVSRNTVITLPRRICAALNTRSGDIAHFYILGYLGGNPVLQVHVQRVGRRGSHGQKRKGRQRDS